MSSWNRYRDLLGKRFGRLLVLSKEPSSPCGASRWLVKCDCGNQKIVQGRALTYTHLKSHHRPLKSCGCLARELRMKNRKPNGTLPIGWAE